MLFSVTRREGLENCKTNSVLTFGLSGDVVKWLDDVTSCISVTSGVF